MKLLNRHEVDTFNKQIRIERIEYPEEKESRPSRYEVYFMSHGQWQKHAMVKFQKGPMQENAGPNGLSNETLLAILIDRLKMVKPVKLLGDDSTTLILENKALDRALETLYWLREKAEEKG